jgi:hypothetical protein
MSTKTEYYQPAELLFQPDTRDKRTTAKWGEKSPTTAVYEPERRLWKLTTSANPKKLAIVELFVLALFLILACAGIVFSFAELSHLLQTDAVGHVAMRAIRGTS